MKAINPQSLSAHGLQAGTTTTFMSSTFGRVGAVGGSNARRACKDGEAQSLGGCSTVQHASSDAGLTLERLMG